MMQRWREKLKYIEAGMIISALILFVATLIFGDNLTLEVIAFIVGTMLFSRVIERMDKKEIEKMKCQEEEELKNIAVAPVILEDGRLSFCVPGDDGPPWSGAWNLTGKIVLDGDDYIYESIGHLVGWCFFRGEMEVAG